MGEENRFGHPFGLSLRTKPSTAVLRRLDGALLLRTDRHGTVLLETDGVRLWVGVERQEGAKGSHQRKRN